MMDVLGDNWGQQQAANILGDLAHNPGTGGVGTMGAGIGMGVAAGSLFGNMANQMFSPINQQNNRNFNEDPIEALGKLKKMFESGLIEQNEYEAKKSEILKRM